MGSKNLLITPCGNRSKLFRKWLEKKSRDYDVCLLFYNDHIEKPELYTGADYFFHLKDFKFHMIHKVLTELKPQWLDTYEYFFFPDDDIDISANDIEQIFLASKTFDSWISQPSLSKDSFCSWPILKQNKNCFCRYVGQVEVMAPLFNREGLKKCLPSFTGTKSSWGIDSVWPKILDYPRNKMIVFDSVAMRHTEPVGGGELYKKLKIDPKYEWNQITEKYGSLHHNYREYGRLQIVNAKTNRLIFKGIEMKEKIRSIKRLWVDYDLGSRIRSRMRKIGFYSPDR